MPKQVFLHCVDSNTSTYFTTDLSNSSLQWEPLQQHTQSDDGHKHRVDGHIGTDVRFGQPELTDFETNNTTTHNNTQQHTTTHNNTQHTTHNTTQHNTKIDPTTNEDIALKPLLIKLFRVYADKESRQFPLCSVDQSVRGRRCTINGNGRRAF